MIKVKAKVARLVIVVTALSSSVMAQTAETPARRATEKSVVVERRPAAPQVITVLHRLNGLTMLRALIRSGQPVSAFEDIEEVIQLKGVHTNIIAGLALDDGETIAAWLPEAEVDVEPTLPRPAPPAPPVQPATNAPASPASPAALRASTPFLLAPGPESLFARPDVTIIQRDGKKYRATYVGLDGITGLSLLRLSEKNLPASPIVENLPVTLGQRMRLYAPEPVSEAPAASDNAVYVRLGENDGQVVNIVRGRSGEITRLKVRVAKLSPSNIGAVVLNESGQTIGIVEGIDGNEANVISPSLIRAAAKRVLLRQANVPRPWLGITGEPVAITSLDRVIRKGWETERALSLLQAQRGILLNSVAPNSPASVAALRAGDVIVRVNDKEVKSDDDFSVLLAEAAANPVRFSVMRRNAQTVESVVVELSRESEPMAALRMFNLAPRAFPGNSLIRHGIETLPIRAQNRPLARTARGLFVVFVEPGSAASTAGLATGDVIEEIQGQPVSGLSANMIDLPSSGYTLGIVRNKEKIVLTIVEKE